jgi:DNA-binding CsgD family transcriptional regulator
LGGVHVCIASASGDLGRLAYLRLDPKGVFFNGDTQLGTIDDPVFRAFIEKITGTGISNPTPRGDGDATFADVCQSYEETSSIKKTAKLLALSEERTRKILITEGKYTCKQYEDIKKLMDEGKNINEVSEILKMTPKQIRTYLPYS